MALKFLLSFLVVILAMVAISSNSSTHTWVGAFFIGWFAGDVLKWVWRKV